MMEQIRKLICLAPRSKMMEEIREVYFQLKDGAIYYPMTGSTASSRLRDGTICFHKHEFKKDPDCQVLTFVEQKDLAPVQFNSFTFQPYEGGEDFPASGIHLSAYREDTPGLCDGYWDDVYLWEEEVRRLHSFLSQWLETNQKDYF